MKRVIKRKIENTPSKPRTKNNPCLCQDLLNCKKCRRRAHFQNWWNGVKVYDIPPRKLSNSPRAIYMRAWRKRKQDKVKDYYERNSIIPSSLGWISKGN